MKQTPEEIQKATRMILKKSILAFQDAYYERCKKHNTDPFVNFHEAYGVCAEELHEAMNAIWKNYTKEDIAQEFLDIAVAAFHAYYSFHEDLNEILKAEAIWEGKLGDDWDIWKCSRVKNKKEKDS